MKNNFNITSASVSDRGLSEKRPENEDSYLVLDERGVYAVADGVGGAQAGDVASQMAMEILGEAFLNRNGDLDAEEVMRAAIERANSAIYQMASDLPQLSSMATTVVALHLEGDVATIGHVGDSRLYRLDRNGTLRRETNDHSVVEEEVRAGRMTPEQAQHHPSKNVISRALGAEPDVEIDLKTIMVDAGTTFLLCSDGITRHIEDREIETLLGEGGEPTEMCDRLKEVCFERGAEDNLTAVVVRIAAEPAEAGYSVAAAGAGAVDVDEATVASARSPFESTVETDEEEDFSAHDTVAIHEPKGLDDGSYLMQEDDEDTQSQARAEYVSSSVVVPAPVQLASSPISITSTYDEPAEERPSAFSRVLSSVLFLVLGGVLGAGGYYFWLQSQPQPVVEVPVLTEAKSNNVPLTSFEEGRRIVDRDPAHYITAQAASLQNADDYFLMGRAFLLTGKYWEAKRSFTEARNRLAAADSNNARTLANEIAMALAIIESPQATEAFQREISAANAAGSGTNSNSNPNTNSNSNIRNPIR